MIDKKSSYIIIARISRRFLRSLATLRPNMQRLDSENYTQLFMKQNRDGNNKRRNTKGKPIAGTGCKESFKHYVDKRYSFV